MALAASGLVTGTFGNVSGADFDAGVLVIKPSGVPYDALKPADLVHMSLETGAVVAGLASAIVGYTDASRAVPRLPVRRCRAHPLADGHGVRAGQAAHSLSGDDTRGLLLR